MEEAITPVDIHFGSPIVHVDFERILSAHIELIHSRGAIAIEPNVVLETAASVVMHEDGYVAGENIVGVESVLSTFHHGSSIQCVA